jgi:hypothetical protein
MPVNPEALGHGWKGKFFYILVSESSYPMNNVPTCQTTIQSYTLEGSELIPRDNIIYNVYERQSNGCTGLHRRGEQKLAPLDVVVFLPRSLLHSG